MIFSTLPLLYLLFAINEIACRPSDDSAVIKPDSVLYRPPKGRLAYFDSELLEALLDEEGEKNIVISPVTVKLLLAMLMEGSRGVARNEIRRALRLPDDRMSIRSIVKSWIAPGKEASAGITLNFSTRLFVSSGHEVSADYAAILRDYYSSDVTRIDAEGEQAAQAINSWAKNATNGMIPALIDSSHITPDLAAVLASAVYFKGSWRAPFSTVSTDCFHGMNGTCKDAVFMHITDFFPYANIRTLDADVLELPYTHDGMSMIVMVPHGDVSDLLRDLLHEPIHRVLETLSTTRVNVSIPRFTAQYGQDLRNVLRKLKIKEVFSPKFDFRGTEVKGNTTFGIGNFFHSSKIIVNEEGSEAAGAASIEIRPNMQEDEQEINFKADKPFLFFIRDAEKKQTIFSGFVVEPEPIKADILGVSYIKDTPTYSPIITPTSNEIGSGAGGGDGSNYTEPFTTTTPPPIYRETTATTE